MASYKNKSKPQLINEIESLQKRANELEESETEFFWAKKKLKKQEEQLRAVLDNATIHIWAFDGEWYHYLSKEWYRYTGQDPALPLTIERWTEVVHPDDMDETVKTWFKAWEKKSIYNGYYRMRGAKGKYRLFHSHAVPVYDEKGNLLHYQGYNVDITEQKQAEERLHESEEKYRNLTENMFDIVYSMDTNGILTYISPQTKRYGIDPKKLISKNLLEIIHPEDREKLGIEFCRSLETGEEFPSTFRVLNAKGDIHWFEDIGKIQHDKNGNITGLAGVLRDVTERKKAEEALRVSEERFRQLAESAEEWIWEVDDNALYTYASPVVEKLLGYKPEELVGKKHSYDLFRPDEIEPLKKATLEIFKEKKPLFRFLNHNIHKNGQIVWLSTSGVPILDDKGNLIGYRGADIDITERKKAEEELKKYREHLEKLIKERTKELEEKNKRLEEFNSLFVGREFRIRELKDKINKLEKKNE